jgi:hypothetical protein
MKLFFSKTSQPSSINEQLKYGESLENEGRYREAYILYKNLIKEDRYSKSVRFHLGNCSGLLRRKGINPDDIKEEIQITNK